MSAPVLPRRLATAGLTGLLLLGSGCAAISGDETTERAEGSGGSGGQVSVAASFYPLQFLAERVGGERAQVTGLTQPGGEPHDLELAPRQTAEIADADVVVYLGGFQAAVDDSVEANAGGAVLDVASVADLLTSSEEDHEAHEHEDEGHEHEDEGHGDDEHDGHEHGEDDPHFWLDPLRMADVGDALAQELGEVDPDHAEDYAADAADLRAELEALDAAYEETLASCERETVVVSHDAFGYLERYGLHFEPINGLSPGAEPTPADLARLQDLIASDGITTVFSERLVSARLAESLADDAGVRTAVLDPIEGLGDETADEDYLSLMRDNLAALAEANGCR